MSNYTPIVLYGPKDSLTHGDPNKAIKGVQIDAELAAIATAVTTKNDSANLAAALGSGATQYLTSTVTATKAYGPVATTLVDFTPDTGSWTANYTGFTASVTGAATWIRIGNMVMLTLSAASGTSNATGYTLNNLPAQITPTTAFYAPIVSAGYVDNAINQGQGAGANNLFAQFSNTNTITFCRNASGTGWTASGTKGITGANLIVYRLA